jgi:hypothetical protein
MPSLVVNCNLAIRLISNTAIKILSAKSIVQQVVVGRTTATGLMQVAEEEEITITAILKSDFNFYKVLNKKIPSVLRDGIF